MEIKRITLSLRDDINYIRQWENYQLQYTFAKDIDFMDTIDTLTQMIETVFSEWQLILL